MANVKEWILGLKIRLKLLIAFGSILFLSVILILVGINTTQSVLRYNDLNEKIDHLNIITLEVNTLIQQFKSRGFKQKEFLKNGDSPLLVNIHKEMARQDSVIQLIATYDYFGRRSNLEQISTLDDSRKQFVKEFDALLAMYVIRGFKDHGVEGELRSAIHEVEHLDLDYDRVHMLTLRRHEKDFFLRKDLKYVSRFNDVIELFNTSITNSSLAANDKNIIFRNLSEYQKLFNDIVELEKKIGFSPDDGQQGRLKSKHESIEATLNTISSKIKADKANFVDRSFIFVVSLFIIQIVVGLILIMLYSNILTKAIKEIRSAIVQLSKGSFPHPVVIRTKDEMGQAKAALNQLVDRIREAVGFAGSLGNGELYAEYTDKFKDDVLAKAIISTQKQLQEADKEQKNINWTNHGLALFADILNNDSHTIGELGDRIIQQIVKYLDANQGAVYIVDNDQVERVATYAYSRKKFIQHKISSGQGLLGQTILEGETLLMTDLPDGYTNITSGLGAATPASLVIIPLRNNDTVVGAIELASFQVFKEYEIQLLEKLSENIASILIQKKAESRTNELLEQMNAKTHFISTQEAEINEKSKDLNEALSKIELLEHQIRHYKETLETKDYELSELLAYQRTTKTNGHFMLGSLLGKS